MEYVWLVLSYVFSFKVWIILCAIMFIGALSNIARSYSSYMTEYSAKRFDYNEDKIVAHLDYIIYELLNYYNVFHIAPLNVFYITDSMQQEIINYLVQEVPKRISPSLMHKLTLIYNPGYISTFLGEHIYMIVINYVLNFNLNEAQNKATGGTPAGGAEIVGTPTSF